MCDNVSFLGRKRGKEEELLWTDAKSDKHIFTHTHKYSHMNNLTCCTFIFFCKKNWLDIFTRDSYRWKFRKAVCYYVIFVLPPNNQQVSPSSLTSFKGDCWDVQFRWSWTTFDHLSDHKLIMFNLVGAKQKSNLSG